MKRYIKAQAYSKTAIRDKIEDKTWPVMEALAQLYLFPDEQDVNHWRQEVWSNLYKIYKLKRSNKWPDAEFIYQSTWCEYSNSFKDIVEVAIEHESNYIPNPDRLKNIDMLYSYMDEYFWWLATNLSSKGIVTPSQVYQKLEEFGL